MTHTLLYQANDPTSAQFLGDYLAERGIQVEERGVTSGAGEVFVPEMNYPSLWVPSFQADEAQSLLKEWEAPVEGGPWTCGCGEESPPTFGSCWACGADR